MLGVTDIAGSLQTAQGLRFGTAASLGILDVAVVKSSSPWWTNHDHNAPVNSTQELSLMNPTTGSGHFGVSVLNLSRSIRDHLVSCF